MMAYIALPGLPMRQRLACLALLGCLAAAPLLSAPAPAPTTAGPEAAAITADYMRDVLFFLSSDTLAGRLTPSPGLDTAALYLASNLAQWGLEGGGDASAARDPKLGPLAPFLYHFDLEREQVDHASLTIAKQSLTYGTDFTISGGNGTLTGRLRRTAQGIVLTSDAGATRAQFRLTNRLRLPAYQVDRFLPASDPLPQISVISDQGHILDEAVKTGADVTLEVTTTVQRARAEDVVAILPGADPVLQHQYLIISAHLDHLGVGRPVDGDAIYNGADDDGSGSTALLALARAYAQGPRPRRSIAFIWHAGEEEGLWGSQYFTHFPTIAMADVITDLNMDMIGRSKPAGDDDPADAHLTAAHEIYVIGPQVSSADLERTLETVNAGDERLLLNHYYDRTDDPERIFYRSDHFNYAAQGIPIIFFFDGVHRDYHQPGDEPQKIDYEKMQAVARTVYALGWRLANQDTVPHLNRSLPGALTQAMSRARQQDAADAARFHPAAPRFH